MICDIFLAWFLGFEKFISSNKQVRDIFWKGLHICFPGCALFRIVPGVGDHFVFTNQQCPSLHSFPHSLMRQLLQLCDGLKDCFARSNYSQGPFTSLPCPNIWNAVLEVIRISFSDKQYVRQHHVQILTLREGTLLGREMNTNSAVKRPQVCCTLAELWDVNAWGVAVLLRIWMPGV